MERSWLADGFCIRNSLSLNSMAGIADRKTFYRQMDTLLVRCLTNDDDDDDDDNPKIWFVRMPCISAWQSTTLVW